jgi:predicted TPR repeat methyltransferase
VADPTATLLQHARSLAANGEDEAPKQSYLDILRLEPRHVPALIEIGALAKARFHHSAARSAYLQAVRVAPDNAVARVVLGQSAIRRR